MGAWYRVIKTIKSHRYVYEQRTWREGKHVRTENRYVGPEDGAGGGAANGRDAREQGSRADRPFAAVTTTCATEISPTHIEEAFAALTEPIDSSVRWSLPWNKRRQGKSEVKPVPAIESMRKRLGAAYTARWEGAYYRAAFDEINIPPQRFFTGNEYATATQTYYHTLLHEIAHWTGNHMRLGRSGVPPRKSQPTIYAREEMVAEATAVILLKHFGVAPDDLSYQSAYFQSWWEEAGDRDEALAYAEKEAARAAAYILSVTTT